MLRRFCRVANNVNKRLYVTAFLRCRCQRNLSISPNFAAKILLFIQLSKYIEQKMHFFIQYIIFIAQNRSINHYKSKDHVADFHFQPARKSLPSVVFVSFVCSLSPIHPLIHLYRAAVYLGLSQPIPHTVRNGYTAQEHHDVPLSNLLSQDDHTFRLLQIECSIKVKDKGLSSDNCAHNCIYIPPRICVFVASWRIII